jgi:hypothetical protein
MWYAFCSYIKLVTTEKHNTFHGYNKYRERYLTPINIYHYTHRLINTALSRRGLPTAPSNRHRCCPPARTAVAACPRAGCRQWSTSATHGSRAWEPQPPWSTSAGSRRNARAGAGRPPLGRRRRHLKEECRPFPRRFPAAAASSAGSRRNAGAIVEELCGCP